MVTEKLKTVLIFVATDVGLMVAVQESAAYIGVGKRSMFTKIALRALE